MNRTAVTAVVAVGQLALVGVAVAPQLSARLTGDTYVLAAAPVLQGAAMLAAAAAAVAVLLAADPRVRAAAMVAALALSALAVATLAGDDLPGSAAVQRSASASG